MTVTCHQKDLTANELSAAKNDPKNSDVPIYDPTTTKLLQLEKGCYILCGGFKIRWEWDVDNKRVMIKLYWNYIRFGQWLMDTNTNCVTVGFSFKGSTAELRFCTNWTEQNLVLNGTIESIRCSKKFTDVTLFSL
ncbi:MAG: hypothetical protein AB9861_06575 [Methanosarcina sp.]